MLDVLTKNTVKYEPSMRISYKSNRLLDKGQLVTPAAYLTQIMHRLDEFWLLVKMH